jgi:histone deacetylase complex regulatory component SIN3
LFDFFEGEDLNKYSVQNIGARSKSITDNNITAIYFKETPTLIIDNVENITNLINKEGLKTGYSYI